MDEFSIKAIGLKFEDLSLGNRGCFVGRVVQKLNLKFLLGVIQLCHRSEQALHDVHLVEDRELNRDERELRKFSLNLRAPPRMSQIEVNNTQPMAAITREPEESQNVGYVPAPF